MMMHSPAVMSMYTNLVDRFFRAGKVLNSARSPGFVSTMYNRQNVHPPVLKGSLPRRKMKTPLNSVLTAHVHDRRTPQDIFLVSLGFSTTSGGGIFGRGVDKLGNFVMEGAPLLGNAAGDTW